MTSFIPKDAPPAVRVLSQKVIGVDPSAVHARLAAVLRDSHGPEVSLPADLARELLELASSRQAGGVDAEARARAVSDLATRGASLSGILRSTNDFSSERDVEARILEAKRLLEDVVKALEPGLARDVIEMTLASPDLRRGDFAFLEDASRYQEMKYGNLNTKAWHVRGALARAIDLAGTLLANADQTPAARARAVLNLARARLDPDAQPSPCEVLLDVDAALRTALQLLPPGEAREALAAEAPPFFEAVEGAKRTSVLDLSSARTRAMIVLELVLPPLLAPHFGFPARGHALDACVRVLDAAAPDVAAARWSSARSVEAADRLRVALTSVQHMLHHRAEIAGVCETIAERASHGAPDARAHNLARGIELLRLLAHGAQDGASSSEIAHRLLELASERSVDFADPATRVRAQLDVRDAYLLLDSFVLKPVLHPVREIVKKFLVASDAPPALLAALVKNALAASTP